MFRLFISNSEPAGWKRARREVLLVALVLLALELIVRIEPIHALLAERLDPYENLLWYDERMPRYQNQLLMDPNYTLWLLGTSPMMTAWNPAQIQVEIHQAEQDNFTVQNYGFTSIINLRVMAQLIDRWLLQLDQPQYVVLGISDVNFRDTTSERMRIEDSPLENMLIFPDTIDDYANLLLYQNSTLYRYLMLARNALVFPIEETKREPNPLGGYTERTNELVCTNPPQPARQRGPQFEYFQNNLLWLDEFIDTVEAQGIPIMVVSLPISNCQLDLSYGGIDLYRQEYLDPVADHLRERGISFVALDLLYYERIPADERDSHFSDVIHTNYKGAALLSSWLSKAIVEWLSTHPQ